LLFLLAGIGPGAAGVEPSRIAGGVLSQVRHRQAQALDHHAEDFLEKRPVGLLSQRFQEAGNVPAVRDVCGRFGAHDLLQRGIALQFPQAGFHVLVSEEDRQQHDAPEDAHWIIIASAASRRPQAFEQPTVGNAFQQPPDGDQCGMVFETLPREQRLLDIDSHGRPRVFERARFTPQAISAKGGGWSKQAQKKRIPKVRVARPTGRPAQLRYFCPIQQREVRISTGSYDEDDVQQQKAELEAKLLLGIQPSKSPTAQTGPSMPWPEFREHYSQLQLQTLRDNSSLHAESRLDIAERILKPRTLGDVADPHALQQLQAKLLAGAESQRGKPRSRHTVKGYMTSILAAMHWAYRQGWLAARPAFQKIKVGKLKAMKGRPISDAEFQRMLTSTEDVVGEEAAESWKHVLRGLWTSALRIDELMHVSWDIPNTIQPIWKAEALPVLHIPAEMQKNDTEEAIPLLPWFEALLQETPEPLRTGWVFQPASLQQRLGRRARHLRPDANWIGKIISRIGKKAGVVVEQADERTGHPAKYATQVEHPLRNPAHDLRQRLLSTLRPGLEAAGGREADRVVLTRAHACAEPAIDRPADQPAGRSALAALCRHLGGRATGLVGPHGFLGFDRVDPAAAATGHLLVQLADPRCADTAASAASRHTSSWDCWDAATATVARRAESCCGFGIDRGRRWINRKRLQPDQARGI
jgi:integrase